MSGRMASFWLRAGEKTLLLLALLVPLAFCLHSYDAGALKSTLLQAGALCLMSTWVLKGLERGRWELPASAMPMAAPAIVLTLWTIARFAGSASPMAGLQGFLRDLLYIGMFWVAMLEFGGAFFAARFKSWLLLAGWAAGLYGLLQNAGVDPFPWKGAFERQAFSTMGSPETLGLFMAACFPLALSRLVDPERDQWARGADAALIALLTLSAALSASPVTILAFTIAGMISAFFLPLCLP